MRYILLFLISLNLFASTNITLEWINKQPRSIAKDFYIWQYLQQDITKEQAYKAIEQTRYVNSRVFKSFAKKSEDPTYQAYAKCLKLKNKELIKKEASCIKAGLSIYDATKLTQENLSKTIKKLENEFPLFTQKLNILNSPIPFNTLINSDKDTFFGTFNQCGGKYRVKHFNQYFPKKLISQLKKEKEFALTIKLIVTNPKMRKAQISLLNISPEDIKFKGVFHLAINAIRHDKKELALVYLDDAYNKAYYQMEKDNITFWKYLLTKDEKHLTKLSKSWDVNLYTIYAKETLNKTIDNVIYKLEQSKNSNISFDTKTPFEWIKVLSDTKKMNDKKREKYKKLFSHKDTIGHLAFVEERYNRYRKSYFITPYENYIGELPKDRKALIYALARQESRFIPTSISHAFAMGSMQIMPFLSKALAKQLKEPYNIFDQLNPKTNLRYANHHLNYLEKHLKHPLFIAYGYNGGIGFTRRMLKQGLFKKGEYEPFLSMEMLPYDETKKYGKKVLANYYIYQNHLNKDKQLALKDIIKEAVN